MTYTAQLLCCDGSDLRPLDEQITDSRMAGHAIYLCRACGQRWRMQVFIEPLGSPDVLFDPEKARKRGAEAIYLDGVM